MGAVFAAALLLRLLHLAEFADYPAFLRPIIDARAYDELARAWVARGSPPPMLSWQSWFYPLFLAVVYAVSDGAVLAAKLVQAVLGAVTCGLTFVLGRELFGRAAGLIAATMMALYGPLLFYESELLTAGWEVFWAVALVLLLGAAGSGGRAAGAGFGLVGALAILTRPTFLPFVLAGLGWLLVVRGGTARGPRAWAAAVGAGVLGVMLLAVSLVNRGVTGQLGFLPASGGVNVYVGNHPDAEMLVKAVGPEWSRLLREPEHRGLRDPYAQQRYFYARTWEYVAADPAAQLGRLGRKFLQFVCSREIPRSADVYAAREWSVLQTLLTWKVGRFGFPFGLLLPLAVLGLTVGARRMGGPAWLLIVLWTAAVVLVFVAERFRLPLVPVLAVAAAAGLLWLVETLRSGRWRAAGLALLPPGAAVLLATWPGPFPAEVRDFESSLEVGLAQRCVAEGRGEEAIRWYEAELRKRPDSFAAHFGLGGLLARRSPTEALPHLERAVELRPPLAAVRIDYAQSLRQAGRPEEALRQLELAVGCEPDWAEPYRRLGQALLAARRAGDAAQAFAAAVERDAGDYPSQLNLGIALAEAGQLVQAAGAFTAAARLRPTDPEPVFLLGVVCQQGGWMEPAAAAFRIVLALAPDHAEARSRLRTVEAAGQGAGDQRSAGSGE